MSARLVFALLGILAGLCLAAKAPAAVLAPVDETLVIEINKVIRPHER